MYVIAGVDGTGDFNDAEYTRHFRSSFVKRFTGEALAPNSGFYTRGPSIEGGATGGLGEKAAEHVAGFVKGAASKGSQPGVFITGFSRGGAAAIHAAKILAGRKIIVDALFLFDAVDRAVGVDVDEIPVNVRTVYHAMRSRSAESREFFGNCGTRYRKSTTAYHAKWFHCTHGAVGGTPWTQAGSDGKIYEGDSTISIGMMILLPVSVGMIARTSYERDSRTRVTLEQERAGSAKVYEWMKANFDRERDILAGRQRLGTLGPNGKAVG